MTRSIQEDISLACAPHDIPLDNDILHEPVPNTIAHCADLLYFAKIWQISQYKRAMLNYIVKNYKIGRRNNVFASINDIVVESVMLARGDIEIAQRIYQYISKWPKNDARWDDRASERAAGICNIIGGQHISSYLDYGCGDGSITLCLGQRLNVPNDQIFGIDVHDGPMADIVYLHKSGASISDASIDLVTIFVTLHHLSAADLDQCIAEARRVLRPSGLLVIREHDYDDTVEMRAFLDLIHLFVDVSMSPQSDPSHTLLAPINYQSHKHWTKYLYCAGFYLDDMFPYVGNNPQQLYYATYRPRHPLVSVQRARHPLVRAYNARHPLVRAYNARYAE